MRNLPQASSRVTSISRRKLYLAMLTATQFMAAGQVWAGPEGGQVVGGAGSIKQTGTETVINQQTDRMAIDWQSFDVKVDERVQFIQPNSSSVALNRVLSNKGSEILGRVDANGHVFLVNPNGVVFGKDSHINVGGILASGMSIDPTEFMNGNFTLNSIEGTEGKVINSGIINAATGGSVTLLGKEVKNEGLIVANLGAVNLAAGKEAVVTFDSSGLVGVKVTKAILQNELGVDAAVLNTGEINAQGGRILLTASTSQDIFSQAVNHGELNAATSAVVNADGTFTLGGGADVVNTGNLNASSTTGDAGQIVALGNNVTNSGNISANTQNGKAGHIELNSIDTTQLTQNSTVSAQSIASGKGGDIKVLGNKVGAFDSATINASGVNGGGQILFGGDQTGKNKLVNNSNFIYLGENTSVKTDALLNGDGGKLITFAQDTARIYGNLFARGGSESGNGGFIETSGLKGFNILKTPDISAVNGFGGSWLIDPESITIASGNSSGTDITQTTVPPSPDKIFASTPTASIVRGSVIAGALFTGGKVIVRTTGSVADGDDNDVSGNITVDADIQYTPGSARTATLRLEANNDIILNAGKSISTNTNGTLNVEFMADTDGVNGGGVTLNTGSSIKTNGGYFTAGTATNRIETFQSAGVLIGSSPETTITGTLIDTSSSLKSGNISIYTTGNADLGSMSFGTTLTNDQTSHLSNANNSGIGNVTVDSSKGNISLTGNYSYSSVLNTHTEGMMQLIASDSSGKITLTKARIDNGSGNTSKLNLDFQAGNNISINYGNNGSDGNSEIWLKGGDANLKSTSGDILISNSSTAVAMGSEGGDVTLVTPGAVTIKGNGVSTGGGNFTVGQLAVPATSTPEIKVASFTNYSGNIFDGKIDSSGKSGGGDILINSAGDVTLGSLAFTDSDSNTSNNQSGSAKVISGGSVSANQNIDFSGVGSGSFLDISATKNIDINANVSSSTSADKFNVKLKANTNNIDPASGNITVKNDVKIDTKGGYFSAAGKDFTTTSSATILISTANDTAATVGGNVDLDMSGAVNIKAPIKTGGGNFTVGTFNGAAVDHRALSFDGNDNNAKIDTFNAFGGGDIFINTTNNVSLGNMSFGYSSANATGNNNNLARVGSIEVDSSNGSVTLNAPLQYNDSANGTNTGGAAANTSVGSDAHLSIKAANNITIKGKISDDVGDARDSLDVTLVSTGTTGTINIDNDIYTGGGNFSATANKFDSTGFRIDTDNAHSGENSTRSNGGNITLNASSSITLGDLATDAPHLTPTFGPRTGNLTISGISKDANGISTDNVNVTQATNANTINVSGATTFNLGSGDLILGSGSTFTLNSNTYTGVVSVTSAKNVKLKNTAATILGESAIGVNFDLTSGGSITQPVAPSKLVINGDATFTLTSVTDNDIILNNSENDFKNKVNFSGTNFGILNFYDTNSIQVETFSANTKAKSITIAADENVTANAELVTNGGAIQITAGNDVTKGGNIVVGALTTSGASGVKAGDITLEAKTIIPVPASPTTGNISAGVLTAEGGSATGSGLSGGAIQITAGNDVTNIGAISTKGSNASTAGAGGAGGKVQITATNGTISANAITTNGGNASGGGSNGNTGGSAGLISLTANSTNKNILLKNNLTATGGAKSGGGNATDGSGSKITLTGDVQIDNASGIAIDTTGAISGDIEFTKKLDSVASKNTKLTLTGKTIKFGDDVGSNTRLGALSINSSASLDATGKSFYTTSFNLQKSLGFTAALINTSGDTGGPVDITSTGTVTINSIDSSATSSADKAGGAVTIGANKIALGTGTNTNVAINSSGAGIGKAGDINVTASGASPTITLKGDVQAVGGTGSIAAAFILGGADQSEGKIDFSGYTSPFTSNIKVTGRDTAASVTDTFIGQNLDSTWDFATSTIKNTNKISDPAAPTIAFTKFETLTGGTNVDVFNIDVTTSININGGNGNDKFNISADANGTIFGGNGDDEFYIAAAGISAANLYGGKTTTEIGSNDTIFGFDDSVNTNTWNISGSGKGKLTNSAASSKEINFSGMGIVKGGTGVDNFIIGAAGISQTVYGGGGSSIDTLKAYDDTTNDTNWVLTDANSGTLTSGTSINKVTFHQIGILSGSSGKDFFTFSNLFSGTAFDGSINGNAEADTFTLSKDVVGGVKGGAGNDTFNISASITGDVNGEAGADTFKINAPNLVLNIFGGSSGSVPDTDTDKLVGSSLTNIWSLTGANKGTLTNGTANNSAVINFDEIEILNGGGNTAQDTLNSAISGNNIWTLLTKNSGNLNGLSFASMANLVGNDDNDTVIFASNYTGNDPALDAKAGINTVDVSNLDSATVNIKFSNGDFEAVKGVKGATVVNGKVNGSNDTKGSTLKLDSEDDAIWTIEDSSATSDKQNDGTLKISGKSLSFNNFSTLTSGTDITVGTETDNFIIVVGNSFNGTFNASSSGSNTFTNSSTVGTWTLSGAANGNLVTSQGSKTSFNNIQTIIGNGLDTLVGQNKTNTWKITGNNSGTLNTTLVFQGMNNLTGGTGVDTFILGETGYIGGVVKGGTGSVSTTESDAIQIDALNTKNHLWTISGVNVGSLTDNPNPPDLPAANYGITSFQEIEKLIGGQLEDVFKFKDQGAIVSVDGGASKDTLDFSDKSGAVSVTIGASAINGVSVSGIESFVGNNTDSTLKAGSSDATTWTIESKNSGNVIIGANPAISFTNFNNLIGGAGKDTFKFSTNLTGQITGKISGGDGGRDVDEIVAPNMDTTWNIVAGGTNSFIYGGTSTKFESIGILTGSAGYVDNFIFSGATIEKYTLAGQDSGSSSVPIVDILDLSGITNPITLQLGTTGISGVKVSSVDTSLTVSGIEKVKLGSATNNTLNGYSDGSSWDIDKLNGGTITSLSTTTPASMQFEGFKNLTGADNKSDIFTFKTGGSVTGTIDGGATNSSTGNKIIGLNANSDWKFTATNVGTISSGGIEYLHNFQNIQILEGGDQNNNFTIANGASFSGTIKGGAGNGIDSLIALDGANTFIINTANSGSLNTNLIFEGIKNLTGGSNVDIFKFNISSFFGGSIDAGAGGADVVDFSNSGAVIVALGANTIQGVTNAEKVVGNLSAQLKAVNSTGDNKWIITNPNTGTFQNAANNQIQFSNFSTLVGAAGLNDSFTLQSAGSVASIDGGTGSGVNSLTKTDGINTWALTDNVNTGTLNDTNHFSNIQLLAGGSGTDTLVGQNKDTTWTISEKNEGTVTVKENALPTVVNFTGMENLTGNAAVDAFIFSTANSNVTGLIDGGTSDGSKGTIKDTLDLQSLAAADVQLQSSVVVLSSSGLNVRNIETITASSLTSISNNKLTGASDNAYSWLIDKTNGGTVFATPLTATAPVSDEAKTEFFNFGSVTGGTNSDRFTITGSIGNIDGGAGAGIDFVDYSKKEDDDFVVDLGDGKLDSGNVKGIEGVIGNNNGIDKQAHSITIKIAGGTNTWTLGSFDSVTDGVNDGQLNVNNSGTIISFENFNKIIGGSDVDTFNLTSKGKFVGNIDGGGTTNNFNASAATGAQIISINGLTSGATNLIGFSSVSGSTKAASELISLATSNNWLLDGTSSNVNGTAFGNFSTLTGSTGVDTFTIKNITGLKVLLNGADANGVIDSVDLTSLAKDKDVTIGVGATASTDIKIVGIEKIDANASNNNTLIADKSVATNDWSITGANKGTLNKTSSAAGISFTGFANLTGGAGIDNFIFTMDGMISGLIDGGTSTDSDSIVDKVDISALANPITVEIGNTDTNNLNLINIEDIKANAAKANKLIRNDNIAYTWVLSGTNSGTVAPTTIAPALPLKETITSFSGFNQLQGALNTDYFTIADAWTGFVDGGDGDDFVDYSKRTVAFTTTVGGNGSNGVKNVEGFVGNGVSSTIEVTSGTNTWTLGKFASGTDARNDGTNDGVININGATKPIYFIDFNNIQGGSGDDTFNINSGELTGSIFAGAGNDKFNVSAGTVRGTLNGEDGNNTLNINIADATAGKTTFVGGNDNANVINVTGGGVGYLAAHSAAPTTSLSYELNGKTSAIDYTGVATINDDVVADTLALTGRLNIPDVFSLTTNSYTLNKLTTINYKNKDNLKITGDAGDSVEINGAINIPKILTIQNASVSEGENGIINADSLRLDGTAAVGSADKRIKTNIANLYLSSTSGETYLQEANSLNLTSFNTSSLFDLTLAGNLTRSAAITSGGIFNVNTGTGLGNIILDSKSDNLGANGLTGALSLNSSGDVKLSNSGVTILNSVRAQNFDINSDNNINATGDINVTVLATFDTTGNITAKSPTNNFNALLIANAADVDLVNKGKLSVQGINASGNIATQSQGIMTTGKIAGGNVDIKSGSERAVIGGDILASNNLFINAGNIDINSNLTASVIDLNGQAGVVNLNGLLTTAGKQTVNVTAGKINQNAKITSGGTTTLTASGDLNQKADIESGADVLVTAGGSFSLDAGKTTKGNKIEYLVQGVANFLGSIAANTGIHIGGKKEVTQSALLSSADGDIKIDADKLTMSNDAVTTATKGSIAVNTSGDISASALNAENGAVTFATTAGKIIDVNGDKINIVAKKFQADSELGIGNLTDAFETTVSELSLSNNGVNGGIINIQNNAAVAISRLRSNGDITFTNLTGDVVLDNSQLSPYDKTATDARLAGGPMNSNYNIGLLTVNIANGDLLATGAPSLERPDITARTMVINAPLSSIGSITRPLVIYVNKKLEANALKLYQPYWGFNDKPDVVTGAKPISTSLSTDAGQLVQVETIDEVNPAIFTGVRNYVYDDVAILLPLDQRYGDKDKEE